VEQVEFNAPADGYLLKILYNPTNDPGSTVWGLHVNGNGTPTESITVGSPGTGVSTFTFTSAAAFSEGDRLAFSVNPTNDPGAHQETLVFLFNWQTR